MNALIPYLWLFAFLNVPIYAFALIGIARTPLRQTWTLLAILVYFTVVHALTIASVRYRFPAEPFVVILASIGVVRCGSLRA